MSERVHHRGGRPTMDARFTEGPLDDAWSEGEGSTTDDDKGECSHGMKSDRAEFRRTGATDTLVLRSGKTVTVRVLTAKQSAERHVGGARAIKTGNAVSPAGKTRRARRVRHGRGAGHGRTLSEEHPTDRSYEGSSALIAEPSTFLPSAPLPISSGQSPYMSPRVSPLTLPSPETSPPQLPMDSKSSRQTSASAQKASLKLPAHPRSLTPSSSPTPSPSPMHASLPPLPASLPQVQTPPPGDAEGKSRESSAIQAAYAALKSMLTLNEVIASVRQFSSSMASQEVFPCVFVSRGKYHRRSIPTFSLTDNSDNRSWVAHGNTVRGVAFTKLPKREYCEMYDGDTLIHVKAFPPIALTPPAAARCIVHCNDADLNIRQSDVVELLGNTSRWIRHKGCVGAGGPGHGDTPCTRLPGLVTRWQDWFDFSSRGALPEAPMGFHHARVILECGVLCLEKDWLEDAVQVILMNALSSETASSIMDLLDHTNFHMRFSAIRERCVSLLPTA